MVRPLFRALEGLSFPCDRARLIEYARTREAAGDALDTLRRLPQRHYASMSEVLAAVPSKSELRRMALTAAEPADEQELEDEQRLETAATDLMKLWADWYAAMARLWFPWMR